jgi:D-lyxose ketol-isomerase
MKSQPVNLTYEIELQPGEHLTLPPEVTELIGAGRWLITIQPASVSSSSQSIRNHTAFLNSYILEDEGLYDDYTR